MEEARKKAWEAYQAPLLHERAETLDLLAATSRISRHANEMEQIRERLADIPDPIRRDMVTAIHEALVLTRDEAPSVHQKLLKWSRSLEPEQEDRYSAFLTSPLSDSVLNINEVKPIYAIKCTPGHGI